MAIRKKQNQSNYRAGVALVYKQIEKESSFSAKENANGLEDMVYQGEVPYRNSYIRQQDIQFMENKSSNIESKIVTRTCPLILKGRKLLIRNQIFDIVRVDPDLEEREYYIYLELYRTL